MSGEEGVRSAENAHLPYERVQLGNHAQGYECRACYALSASEFAAKKHAEWHADMGDCEDGVFGDAMSNPVVARQLVFPPGPQRGGEPT